MPVKIRYISVPTALALVRVSFIAFDLVELRAFALANSVATALVAFLAFDLG